ncbi:MAG: hypothetical protein KDB07_02120 [Planctomycetes bacterium]|nr:hypothetical protein [Planctomycetota bacterium]
MLSLNKVTLTNHLCARDAGRYALDCLCLTPQGVVSSDGYTLLIADYPEGCHGPDERVLVHHTDAKHAASLSSDRVELDVAGQTLNFEAGERIMSARQPDGEYPDIKGLVPQVSDAVKLTFGIKHLIKALRTLEKVGSTENVTICFKDADCATALQVGGAAALVMPINVEAIESECFDALRGEPALA